MQDEAAKGVSDTYIVVKILRKACEDVRAPVSDARAPQTKTKADREIGHVFFVRRDDGTSLTP